LSLIVALDYPDLKSCEDLIQKLEGLVKIYKIGSELFTAEGWKSVDRVKKYGGEVFLDLKLHDIPTTVARTARVIAEKEVFMFNVHALGGLEMMREARKAVEESKKPRPLLVGVTLLTHLEEKTLSRELGIQKGLREEVLALARLAKEAGLDGVVSSPQETEFLRKEMGEEFVLVTPGVRPAGGERHEQRRSLTPQEAIQRGADYLVIGRPITEASDPKRVTQEILASIS